MPITQELLNQTDALAREAGAAIMEIYGRDFSIEQKEDKSPLTEADAAAHHIIVNGLARLPLQAPVLSEEDTAGFAGTDAEGRYWLVDPLDGTKEFIKRNGEFTVNIALIEHGRPVLGVVYAPALDVGYMAAEGLGAFRYEGDEAPVAIAVAEHKSDQPWRVVGSRSHAGGELPALLEKLGEHELVAMGSSLKLCLVAEGKADVYPRLGPTSLWDTGAAQCVVEQAGGRVLQLNGEPLSYANTKEVLNPYFLVLGNNEVNWPELFG
ncbi:3'(2'),5'-bisphosphate nucleotidase CysQ [Oceanimonas pelagia]|uniref:3'(2'),5'-bisphosphate nucleotidase CysQ n=1 Tax=Oceanimonas pelagia TaxID=3028314 RepID=A0AA50QCI6_9GAMM|nr:3'(2'),5'-bisphosphate nucleotidase CysQ [Oceanimonas pelagia]WMC11184.1 3'(2'),5'-bisphosphate nucleotidase CysQ [Oceanimonas pelagia]